MKQFFNFIHKEFLHVFRDKKTLLILFGLPIVQIMIFGFALSNEVKNSAIAVFDQSHDTYSHELTDRIASNPYFHVVQNINNRSAVGEVLRSGQASLALVIPVHFGQNPGKDQSSTLQIIADGSDPNTANIRVQYLNSILADFSSQIELPKTGGFSLAPVIRMLYNPELKSAQNFVPGVMALVLLMICVLMTSVSIVREKETGTMEILLVSPFRPYLVLFSKAIPYLLLALLDLFFIVFLSVAFLELPVKGNLLLFFSESLLFIITCLSLGLFISVKSSTQQQAMLFSVMALMMPSIFFSGFIFPIENMPFILQLVSNLIPSRWYYLIVQKIMIKGLGFAFIWKESLVLLGMSVLLLFISIRNFKIRLS